VSDLSGAYLIRALVLMGVAFLLLWVDLHRLRIARNSPYRIAFTPFESAGEESPLRPYGGEWRVAVLEAESGKSIAHGTSHLGHAIELRLGAGKYRIAATRHPKVSPRPAHFVSGSILELAVRTGESDSRVAVILPLDDPDPDTIAGADGVRVIEG